MAELPFVSIILPCRNEERYIGSCLESILTTTYPPDRFEVLVIDGRSDDDTRGVVAQLARAHSQIRLLDNPLRITPVALNIGIEAAHGAIIVRMDAHVGYPPEYLASLVNALQDTGADNVGGVIVTLPAEDTLVARAIAVGLSHPLGVGNSYFRIGAQEQRDVDTVPFGCFRREVFDRVGMFDEELPRGQDEELNFRLIRRGGRVVLVPNVLSYYYARASLRLLGRMYYQYGYYKPRVAQKVGAIMTARQLVPAAFVLSLLVTGVAAAWSSVAATLALGIAGSYSAVVLGGALLAIPRHGVACALRLLAVFPVLHFSYGIGFLAGAVRLLSRRRRAPADAAALPVSR